MSFPTAKRSQGTTESILFTFDYGQALDPGDTIATSSWAITGVLGNLTPDTPPSIVFTSFDDFRANVRVSGGTLNNAYYITNTMRTASVQETLVNTLQLTMVQK